MHLRGLLSDVPLIGVLELLQVSGTTGRLWLEDAPLPLQLTWRNKEIIRARG